MNTRISWLGAGMAMILGTTPLAADPSEPAEIVRTFTVHIEVAGADEADRASDKELKESGTKMVPAQPSADSRNPLAPEPKAAEAPKIPAPEVPAAEPKTETKATDAGAESKPANAADEIKKVSDQPAEPVVEKAGSEDDLYQTYARLDAGFTLSGDPDGSGRNGTYRETSIQNTGFIDVGGGLTVDKQMRLEGVFTYRSGLDIDGTDGGGSSISGELENLTAMVNLIYDIEEAHEYFGSDTITPYVGAGLGVSMLDTDSLTTTGGPVEQGTETYNLAYSFLAGLGFRISEQLTLDVGYRFVNLGQFEQDGDFSTGINAAATKFDDLLVHEFKGGLRFRF